MATVAIAKLIHIPLSLMKRLKEFALTNKLTQTRVIILAVQNYLDQKNQVE